MKLGILHEEVDKEPCLILEAGYGRVLNFNYDKFNTDPNPRILYLGKYRNSNTGRTLIGGVNLNYLNDQQIERLRKNLRTILRSGRNLKTRWQTGNKLLPDIFPNTGGRSNRGGYRTYDSSMIHIRSQSTITPQELTKKKPAKAKTVSKPARATDRTAKTVSKPARATDRTAKTVSKPARATTKAKEKAPKVVEPEVQEPIEPEPAKIEPELKSEQPKEPDLIDTLNTKRETAPESNEIELEPELDIKPSGFPQDVKEEPQVEKPHKPVRTSKVKKK